MSDMLYFLKKLYNLKKLEQLDFHPNANDYKSYGFISGYKGFFGEPTYSERWIYNRVFRWTTNNNCCYTVVIEPKVKNSMIGVVEDYDTTLKELKKYIEETL